MRRAARLDENHREIVAALEASGALVQTLTAVGAGCPDIAVWFRQRWRLLEIKRNAKAKLTPAQVDWHRKYENAASVVRTAQEALSAIGATPAAYGCAACLSGSLEHADGCSCECHAANRREM